ncbi:hypothetical protein D5039_21580 [Verminephrobacter aporrectodeae subsp. tuberculatae]|uniref:Transposase n=1 Tax=Verminephrobacter aporrectodeae subsp. tuberculatae TaxID=1110392 RepID=A0ABT3KZ71_9BURK|nr:hypothetical protein [Verminephrobacter aporrectodeae subsp. tuberculatae]
MTEISGVPAYNPKSGRIRRGNAWVRRLLCEFAQAAARTRCECSRHRRTLRSGRRQVRIVLASESSP